MGFVAEHVEQKTSHKWSKNRKLQRRQEKYAAMGPNCRNGHPWRENARFTYKGYRFCAACAEAKAVARRNDPATYTGLCTNGHPFNHKNTLVTNWNSKICRACQQANEFSTSTRVSTQAKIKVLLERARAGDHAHLLVGRTPSLIGKIEPVVSSKTLRKLVRMDTPECQELRSLLKANSFYGRHAYRWNDEIKSALSAEAAKQTSFTEITLALNQRFDMDFTVPAVMTKAGKLGIVRPAKHLIVPRLPKLPRLIAALHFPIGSLLDRINAVVPRHLTRDHRDDVVGEMALAIYDGELEEADIERRVREFVNAGYRREHDKFGLLSLDVPIFEDGTTTLGDRVTTGLWQ
jgi:hypothetical protein